MNDFKGKEIRLSYSGGSDSDACAWVLRYLGYNIKMVFYDTGLEYDATRKHLDYMMSLGYDIDIVKPEKSIPNSVYHYGKPFISKNVSEMIFRLQQNGFDFEKDGLLDFDEAYIKYPNSKSALRWWTNYNNSASNNISWNRGLKEFLLENNGVPFSTSAHCCYNAKKLPAKNYAKENKVQLAILGIRRAEGGKRSTSYNSCYIKNTSAYPESTYMPLFWWTNEDKKKFKEITGIKNSDCYEVYGMERTGCVGCPFGMKFEEELSIISEYEPKLEKAVKHLFNDSYEFTKKYHAFKETHKQPGYYSKAEIEKRKQRSLTFKDNPAYERPADR